MAALPSPDTHLRTAEDFAYLRQMARRPLQEKGVRLYFAPSRLHLPYARLGMSISKKSGKAVRRNRLRRCWREIFRQHAIGQQGLDILAVLAPRVRLGSRHSAVETTLCQTWQHLLAVLALEKVCGKR